MIILVCFSVVLGEFSHSVFRLMSNVLPPFRYLRYRRIIWLVITNQVFSVPVLFSPSVFCLEMSRVSELSLVGVTDKIAGAC